MPGSRLSKDPLGFVEILMAFVLLCSQLPASHPPFMLPYCLCLIFRSALHYYYGFSRLYCLLPAVPSAFRLYLGSFQRFSGFCVSISGATSHPVAFYYKFSFALLYFLHRPSWRGLVKPILSLPLGSPVVSTQKEHTLLNMNLLSLALHRRAGCLGLVIPQPAAPPLH